MDEMPLQVVLLPLRLLSHASLAKDMYATQTPSVVSL